MAMQPDKKLIGRLNQFLDEHDMSITDLARAMDWKYNTVWVAMNVYQNVSGDFKWSFQQTFGVEAAQAIFEAETTPDKSATKPVQNQ